MTLFDAILAEAQSRVGGAEALAARLPTPKSADALRATSDDRYLSLMAQRIFRAGLRHAMVDAKWPAFEEVFMGFEPRRVRAMPDEALEALMADTRIIRHWGKIKATRENAAAICALTEELGGFGGYLADWPEARIVELWDDLVRRFTQMGGKSASYFLRMTGKDTFLWNGVVMRALVHWGAVEETPKGKSGNRRMQAAFNDWAEATGLPLSHLSMILALSID